ncbi:hypothetical protein DSO57_1036823 [Entomophthora muscae]|uniref:Uncharacterized protein n=1 Tax=Entomophthora muscae TaxID=34485 RepID=A0ACC2UJH4_9FUNG|nr:hypothetical protein DSO57_1036823 [Entomophthora muscae]
MSLPSFVTYVAFISALALLGCLATLILQPGADTVKLSVFVTLVACGYYGKSMVFRVLAKIGLLEIDQQLDEPAPETEPELKVKVVKQVRFSGLELGPTTTKVHKIVPILKPCILSPTAPAQTLSFTGLYDIPFSRRRRSRRRGAIFDGAYDIESLLKKNIQAVRDALDLHNEVLASSI